MLLNCGGEKTLEHPSSRDCKEIKPVNLKENQPWIIIGKTDAEVSVLWPPNAKSQLVGKDCVAGKDWGQEEKGAAESESITDSMDMNLSKLQEIVKDREARYAVVQVCCGPRGHGELDVTELLNNRNKGLKRQGTKKYLKKQWLKCIQI